MPGFSTILATLLCLLAIVGAGVFARVRGWLTEQADDSLARLITRLLLPCYIVGNLAGGSVLDHLAKAAAAPVLGFLFATTGILLGWWIGRLALREGPARRSFGLCAGVQNFGYLPIPLVALLFPKDERLLGFLLVHNVGVELAVWTTGLLVLRGRFGREAWRGLLNPVVLALGLALVLHYAGARAWLERQQLSRVWDVLTMLGVCAVPMSLVLIGATAADHWRSLHGRDGWPTVLLGAAFRFGLMPLLFLAGAKYLPGLDPELRRVLVIQGAMPAAMFPIVLSRMYGGDPTTALRVALPTTLLAIVLTPAWLLLGLRWVSP